jgi:uncharacterized membrane protein
MRYHISRYVAILIICLCLASFVASATAATESTSIKVDLQPNGDSIWTTEKQIPLETQADIDGWDATAQEGTDQYKADFEARMRDYVARISADTGRPMRVQNVNVTVEKSQPYTVSGNNSVTYGVLRYQFTWTAFSVVRGDSIEVGDAFVDGFVLNSDDTIRFILPPNYAVTSVSPSYDDLKQKYQPEVIWYGDSKNSTEAGTRLFASGEPSITIRSDTGSLLSFGSWMLLPVAIVSAVLGFGAAFFVYRKKRMPEMPASVPVTQPAAVEVPVEALEPPSQVPDLTGSERYMSDEEKIIMYLEESSGQMFQSDLVKKTDFSKSKLSMVLSDLKDKGTIIKIKKGKENLIRLNREKAPQDTKENSH